MKSRYTEQDILDALNAVANGKSLWKAALEGGILRSTLQDCLNATTTHQEAASHLQRLLKTIEDRLTEWVLTQEALGHSITHVQIKVFGERLYTLQGDNKLLGK